MAFSNELNPNSSMTINLTRNHVCRCAVRHKRSCRAVSDAGEHLPLPPQHHPPRIPTPKTTMNKQLMHTNKTLNNSVKATIE